MKRIIFFSRIIHFSHIIFFSRIFFLMFTFQLALLPSLLMAQYHHPLSDKSLMNRKQPVFTYDPASSFRKIPIIYYHQTPANFEGILKFLISYRFTFITMDNLYDYFQGRYTMPKKPIIVQFDDGADDVYTAAYPLLKKYHVKATLNVCTYFINEQKAPPGDPGRSYSPMTWAQIQEMIDSSAVDVQSHTHSHFDLTTKTQAVIDSEIKTADSLLKANLTGINVRHIAYPFSAYNELVKERVKAFGYRTGRAGGNQEDGTSNRQQTGMYTTIAEDIYVLKILWTAQDLFADQGKGNICPNDNLLPDVDYAYNSDEGYLGWTTILNGNGTVTFPENEGYDGGKCVKITRTDTLNQTYYISRRIFLEPNGNYVFGCRIKTDGVRSARLQCVYWKPDLITVAATNTYKEVTTTQDWTDYSYQYNNNGYYAVDVRVYLNNSTGTAWFDDISFKKKLSY